jgi:hypothetical protein
MAGQTWQCHVLVVAGHRIAACVVVVEEVSSLFVADFFIVFIEKTESKPTFCYIRFSCHV